MRPTRPILAVAVAVLVGALACTKTETPTDPGGDAPVATSIVVSPGTFDVDALTTTVQLSAEVRDQNGDVMAGAAVSWTSNAAAVASVSASGLVTALDNGSATIGASSGSASGTASLTIDQAAFSVTPSADTVRLGSVGAMETLTVSVADPRGQGITGASMAWIEDDPGIVTVDAGGTLTAVATGTGTVTVDAMAGGTTASVTIVVEVGALAMGIDDFCGDFTPDSEPAFGNARFEEEVRGELGIGPADTMTCAMLATVDSLFPLHTTFPLVTNIRGAQNLVGLEWLRLAGHALGDLSPLADLPVLRYLNLSDAGVDDVTGLGSVTSLEVLILSGNPILDFTPLQPLTGLTQLTIFNQPFGDDDAVILPGMTSLETLSLGYTGITDATPLSGLTSLRYLWLGNTDITDVSALAGLVNLEELSLASDTISDISMLSGLSALTVFDIGNAGIADITGISGMTSLVTLGIDRNPITDISELATLTALEVLEMYALDLTFSDISPLQGLTNLTDVEMHTNNAVVDISPLINNVGFATGDFVNLVFTSVSCPNANTLRAKGVEVQILSCPAPLEQDR